MQIYRVCLIGHRIVDDPVAVDRRLNDAVTDLILSKEYVEFMIGRHGDFDILAASCIKHAMKRYDRQNASLTLVLPYEVKGIDDFENYYSDVIIPEELSEVHRKRAITVRNRWMVENSDLLIAHVIRESGGAATCLKMADDAGIDILRI